MVVTETFNTTSYVSLYRKGLPIPALEFKGNPWPSWLKTDESPVSAHSPGSFCPVPCHLRFMNLISPIYPFRTPCGKYHQECHPSQERAMALPPGTTSPSETLSHVSPSLRLLNSGHCFTGWNWESNVLFHSILLSPFLFHWLSSGFHLWAYFLVVS